jgi:PPOX class probable F420-dependent enzyme
LIEVSELSKFGSIETLIMGWCGGRREREVGGASAVLSAGVGVIPENDFGQRARRRLRDEQLIWFTTTSADGSPQPNPVWFLWEEDTETVLIYNATNAKRLEHVAVRPRVALNFETDENGDDVMIFLGVAEQALDAPANSEHDAYLDKYREGIATIGSNLEKFAKDYSVPLRIRLTKVRGF